MFLAFSSACRGAARESHMVEQTVDQLLSAMVRSKDGISDLLFTVGKPPLLEAYGAVEEYGSSGDAWTGEEINQLADHIINGDARLSEDLARWGSCDCSYAPQDLARFRINIFRQNGRPAIVMRKLQSRSEEHTSELQSLRHLVCR